MIARDELPNDSAPEHPAGARHEHAHTEVMSIERLNIAGLIVPESGGGQTMVEFDLTDEQRLLQKTAHEFAEREMRPVALEYDKKGTVPWDVIGKAHALGLDTAFIPEAYGGGGIDSALTHVIVNEELNWGCAGMATGLIGAGLAYLPIIHMGTEHQKKRFLTRFTGKEARLGALCLTEPDAGSDAANLSTTATLDGDEWILNGQKRFISNGSLADYLFVYAREPGTKRHEGLSCFMVPKGTRGFTVTKVETTTKLGLRASPTADLAFEDCRVPKGNLVGKRGNGWDQVMRTLNNGRLGIAAGAVGVARAALEAAVRYARQRKAFNRPIGDFQLIREMISESATEIDAARLLTLRAAHLRDLGVDNTKEVSMAKLFGAQMAMRVTDRAIQVHGGYGFSGDFDVERYFRDARILGLYEGTNEIQKLIIAEQILGPSSKRA